MTIATDLLTSTKGLLKDLGAVGTITTRVQGVYDATTSIAPVTDTITSVMMALTRYRSQDVIGTLIEQDDRKATIQATDVNGVALTPPRPKDKVTWGGIVYAIQTVQAIDPGGTVIFYSAQVRAGG